MHGPSWPFETVEHCDVFGESTEEGVLTAMIEWRRLGSDHRRDVGRLRSNRQIDIIKKLAEREAKVLTIADAFGKRA